MNLVNQFFPKRENSEDLLADNLMMVMQKFNLSKRELDNLPLPTYITLRDFLIRQMKEEQKAMKGIKTPNFRGRR
jgi:hypothetical protein